ncbi:tetratricopeptide repeat protein [uncultured Aquimarina sp.]|uniref:tetratricopeptide repeat protein n=1 Tax=uncultured Aquimarina sp. TaxID=575652 RepID=UPI002612E8D2|nr:tetratricopeptide repeat protein [uncultured Aquimarina sp.]
MDNNTKNKKIFIALEFLIFLIIPSTIFLMITSKNKSKIEDKAVIVQVEKTLNQEELQKENSLIQQGVQFMIQKKYKESIKTNLEVLSINENNKVAHNNLCFAYGEIRQFENGIKHCNKAIELDPNFQLAKNNLELIKRLMSK